MNEKFAIGCSQLASKIGALFSDDVSRLKHIPGLPVAKARAIVPVLVLQDSILRVPLLNWHLNREFQEQMKRYSLRAGTRVRPLNVVNINELETMVNSQDAVGFDLIYALHHRAVRDEEMVSNLQEFLMEFANYGKGQSARTKRVYDELKGHMFSYLFPAETKQGGAT